MIQRAEVRASVLAIVIAAGCGGGPGSGASASGAGSSGGEAGEGAPVALAEADADASGGRVDEDPPVAPEPLVACTLAPVLFAHDSMALDDAARAVLDADAACVAERDLVTVTIVGHAEARRDEELELATSERYARIVADALVQRGVARERMRTRGESGGEGPFPRVDVGE